MMTDDTASKPDDVTEIGKLFDQHADDWDQFYADGEVDARSFEYLQRRQVALSLIDRYVPKGERVFEVGCGAGHASIELAKRGYQMTCLDPSPKMLAHTEKTFAAAGHEVRTVLGTADQAPADVGPVHGIFALGVMDYIHDLDGALRHLTSLLAPGGVFVLSFSNSLSPAEWFEAPLKRALSRVGPLTKFSKRLEVIASLDDSGQTVPRSAEEVNGLYRRLGLSCLETRHLGFGVRFGSTWFPPMSVVRASDDVAAHSPVKKYGRTFFAIARK